jgi:hypothetical protein
MLKPKPSELDCVEDEWEWDIGAHTLSLAFWPIDCWQNRWAVTMIDCKGVRLDMIQTPWVTATLSRKLYIWPALTKYRAQKDKSATISSIY